jgi:hypothetical protein
MFPDDRPLRMPFSEWLRHQYIADELLLHRILWTDDHVLRVRMCSTSTTVTYGHGIILMLSTTVVSILQHQGLGWNCGGHCREPLSAT